MKKVLMIFMISSIVSCGYATMDNTISYGIVITSIEQSANGACDYYGRGNGRTGGTIITYDTFKFRDTCGKFQIGDTINLVKK